jgi:hypothetical protein
MKSRFALMLICAVAAATQSAQAQDELIGELSKCAALAEPGPRLACYDALAPKIHAGTATSPEDLSKQFGAAAAPETVDSITAGVMEYSFNPFGRFVVFLDNGQIWRQLDADTGRATFGNPPSGNMVTISRGAFGSYNLRLAGQNALFKVRRVK